MFGPQAVFSLAIFDRKPKAVLLHSESALLAKYVHTYRNFDSCFYIVLKALTQEDITAKNKDNTATFPILIH